MLRLCTIGKSCFRCGESGSWNLINKFIWLLPIDGSKFIRNCWLLGSNPLAEQRWRWNSFNLRNKRNFSKLEKCSQHFSSWLIRVLLVLVERQMLIVIFCSSWTTVVHLHEHQNFWIRLIRDWMISLRRWSAPNNEHRLISSACIFPPSRKILRFILSPRSTFADQNSVKYSTITRKHLGSVNHSPAPKTVSCFRIYVHSIIGLSVCL